jgi:hypothetical protein
VFKQDRVEQYFAEDEFGFIVPASPSGAVAFADRNLDGGFVSAEFRDRVVVNEILALFKLAYEDSKPAIGPRGVSKPRSRRIGPSGKRIELQH